MTFLETELGLLAEDDRLMVFFGNRHASFQNLQTHFSGLKWSRIRQTHSDLVLEVHEMKIADLIEADAQISMQTGLGLLISTADCVPVFLFDPESGWIAGIHAGWRGVASRIIPKTIGRISASKGLRTNMQAMIGPHIHFGSFEIAEDVKELLLSSAPTASVVPTKDFKNGKFLLDLNQLVRLQLKEYGIQPTQVTDSNIDTKTDLRFHSHRRDQAQAGRQLSFICRKK